MTAGDIGIEKLRPGVATLETDKGSVEIRGRTLAIVLKLVLLQGEMNSTPKGKIVLDWKGSSLEARMTKSV